MSRRRILTAAAAAGLLVGITPARAAVAERGPVRVRVASQNQADVIGDRAITLLVRNRGARRLRLTAAAGRGPVRRATVAAHRATVLRLALNAAALSRASWCRSPRLGIVLYAKAGARHLRLRTIARVLPGAPTCRRFFGPDAVWNQVLPDDAPLDPDSAKLAAGVDSEIAREYREGPPPTINTTSYSAPVYAVPGDESRVVVRLDDPSVSPELASRLAAVPIPPGAEPAAGTDAQMVVWQPSRDAMWEFWGMRHAADGWHTRWGGALAAVTRGPGHFAPPDATWGATATGLPLAGGLITPRELERGVIPHALAIALPDARAGVYAAPAQRTDGQTQAVQVLPEGARLRLDPHLDLGTLHLSQPLRAIAVAAQRYGLILRDRGGDAALYAQDPISLPADVYPRLFGGRPPAEVLRAFPWNRLQVMRMDLHNQEGKDPWPVACNLLGCP